MMNISRTRNSFSIYWHSLDEKFTRISTEFTSFVTAIDKFPSRDDLNLFFLLHDECANSSFTKFFACQQSVEMITHSLFLIKMTSKGNLRCWFRCKEITSQLLGGKQKTAVFRLAITSHDHNKNININFFPYYSHFTAMMRRLDWVEQMTMRFLHVDSHLALFWLIIKFFLTIQMNHWIV